MDLNINDYIINLIKNYSKYSSYLQYENMLNNNIVKNYNIYDVNYKLPYIFKSDNLFIIQHIKIEYLDNNFTSDIIFNDIRMPKYFTPLISNYNNDIGYVNEYHSYKIPPYYIENSNDIVKLYNDVP